jgi:hypothetical protein
VITTEGGLWEQITWGLEAIYANPFDTDEFGHALASVLAYPRVAAQMAKFGTQKARARFTWNGVAQQVLEVLDDIELHPGGERRHAAHVPAHGVARGPRYAEADQWKEEVFS